MSFSQSMIDELELLNLFNLGSSQQGLKIHHDANKSRIEAGKRLHAKGLITQADGGYLTSQGQQAAEHAQALVKILAG